jgi:hypothetical protein
MLPNELSQTTPGLVAVSEHDSMMPPGVALRHGRTRH